MNRCRGAPNPGKVGAYTCRFTLTCVLVSFLTRLLLPDCGGDAMEWKGIHGGGGGGTGPNWMGKRMEHYVTDFEDIIAKIYL